MLESLPRGTHPSPPVPSPNNPDSPQGSGVYVFASGQQSEGRWEGGKKHGWSVYTVETGAPPALLNRPANGPA